MTTYRIVNKETNKVTVQNQASSVAAWFLARQLGNYFIIKSDEGGDRLFEMSTKSYDVIYLQQELEKL